MSAQRKSSGASQKKSSERQKPSISLCKFVREALSHVPFSPRQWEVFEAIDRGVTDVLIAWGRRSGKTRVSAAIGLWHCLPRPEFHRYMSPNEGRKALVVATNLQQARGVIDAAWAMIQGSPMLRSMVVNTEKRDQYSIQFKHGTVLEAMPCSARGDRGRGASYICLDEFSHHFDSLDPIVAASAAENLHAALVPAASQFKELRTEVVCSTPSGDSNKFARLRDEMLDHPNPRDAYFHGPTWEISPLIAEADLEQERRFMGEELFRQEYEASFLTGGGFFLANESIQACVEERGDLYPDPRMDYVVGLDPAFTSDVFGCVVLGVDRHSRKMHVAQVHGWEGRRARTLEAGRLREDEVLENVVRVCRAYDCKHAVTDVFKAREIADRLREHGISCDEVQFNGEWRRDVFANLRLAIDEGNITLPNHPDLLRELRALRVKYTSQGQKVELARVGRSHCDRAVALAVAIMWARNTTAYAPIVVVRQPPPGYLAVHALNKRYSPSEFG
jgi:hypothetical protein